MQPFQEQRVVAPEQSPAGLPVRRVALPFYPLFVLLLAVALGVRLYGLNWDQGGLFHPDERAIYMKVWDMAFPTHDLSLLLKPDESPWNPRWFPYGSFPLYLLKAGQNLLSLVMSVDFGDLRLVGRVLSALADTGTVAVVFLLGRRLFGLRTGLLAALLLAFAVIHVQLSHFFAVETFFTLFIAVALFFLLRVMERGRRRDSALAGVFVGLALATKVSAAPVLIAVGVAYLAYALSPEGQRFSFGRLAWRQLGQALLGGVLTLGMAGVAFTVAAPYALLDWRTFLADVLYQGSMVTREFDLPYTRQYIDTPAYWYQVQQLSTWGLGLPLGVVAWAGLVFALVYGWRSRSKGVLLLLAWVVPYFLITGAFQVKFLRYLLPVVPFLVLFGAHLLVTGVDAVASRRPRWPKALGTELFLAQGGVLLVLAATAFYAFAYLGIYAQPHTATRASQWVRENISPGSVLLTEHWEEGFPNLRDCSSSSLDCYRFRTLPMYEADTPGKETDLAQSLAEGDYILFFSNRLYGTIPRLPERYPMSTRYYQALFSGELGYELVDWETSYPNLMGVSFVDNTFSRPNLPVPAPLQGYKPSPVSLDLGYADESFTVYDHPKVLILWNVQRLSRDRLLALLDVSPYLGASVSSVGTPPGKEPPLGLMMTPQEVQAQRAGGTWGDIIHPEGWGSRFVPWSWLLLLAVMAGAGLPLALLLFRSLPDKGYLFAKPLGILVVAYVVWLLASLKAASFSAPTIYLAILGVGGVSLGLAYFQRRRLLATVKEQWRLWLVEEAVFLAAFFAFLLIRVANPDLFHPWRGGEKFMELAYLTAVTKSTFMPPYDPWFAGGALNYYYFGYFIIAVFIKALGVAPAVAFNLAIPLLFALMVGGAFSLVYNLTALSPRKSGLGGLAWASLGAGITGAIFVAVLGNLDGMAQVLQSLWSAAQSHGLIPFDFWRSSRMMPPDPPGFEITEFPFWSYLFADLHPHMMAIPFTLLALGLALTAFLELQRRGWWQVVPVAGALALALGALWPLNTWDYPTYAGIGVAALVLGVLLRRGVSRGSLGLGLALAGVTLAVSYLLFLPFHLRYQGFSNGLVLSETQTALWQYLGIHGLFVFIAASYLVKEAAPGLLRLWRRSGATRPSGPLPSEEGSPAPSPLSDTSTGAGGLLGLEGSPVAGGPTSEQPSSAPVPKPFLRGWLAFALVTAMLALAAGLAVAGYLVASVLLVGLGLVLHLLWKVLASQQEDRSATGFAQNVILSPDLSGRRIWGGVPHQGEPPPQTLRFAQGDIGSFALLLLGMGLAIGVGVEVVTVKDDIDRMNTVFKFYEQAWVLLALASAFLLWRLQWGLALSPALRRVPRGVWMGFLGLLLVSTLVFPVLGTGARVKDRFQALPWTLDGTAYMREAVYHDPQGGALELRWDLEAIRWLQENVKGSPVVLEGATPLYRWGNRISVYTGLPAIVGWDWHETQQRGIYSWEVQQRRVVVDHLYTTTDIALTLRLLREHQVQYIVVGELERLYYPAEGLGKFAKMEGQSLERVYPANLGEGKTVIYRVKG